MSEKRYIVQLTEEERASLTAIMGLGEQWNRKYGRRLDLGPPE